MCSNVKEVSVREWAALKGWQEEGTRIEGEKACACACLSACVCKCSHICACMHVYISHSQDLLCLLVKQ